MSEDTDRGAPTPHPAIAFLLQYGAQRREVAPAEAANPAWMRAVHAETDLTIHSPFQLGDVITTQGQVIERKQIKPGVLNVERYRMIDAEGRLRAEMDFSLIFRGATLTGSDRTLESTRPPPWPVMEDEPRVLSRRTVARSDLHLYTACSGIYAPIHTDFMAARRAGLEDIVLHGSATKALAVTTIIDELLEGDATRVRRVFGRLRAVVPAGTAIDVRIKGDRSSQDPSAPGREIFFDVLNHRGEPAVADGFVLVAEMPRS